MTEISITTPKRNNRTSRKLRRTMNARQVSKALELSARGLSLREISKVTDAPKTTVADAIARYESWLGEIKELPYYESARSQLLSAAELRILNHLTDKEALQKTSANGLAYAFKQVFDARRLERNLSTANISQSTNVVVCISPDQYREP
jgi:transposase